jgi:hypothetical protein
MADEKRMRPKRDEQRVRFTRDGEPEKYSQGSQQTISNVKKAQETVASKQEPGSRKDVKK